MVKQHISFVILNPDMDTFKPELCINHTLTIDVEEYISFLPLAISERFKAGVVEPKNSTEHTWLIFPTIIDLLLCLSSLVGEVQILRNCIVSAYTHTTESFEEEDSISELPDLSSEDIINSLIEDYRKQRES